MRRYPRVRTAIADCKCGVRFTVVVGPAAYMGEVKHRPNTHGWEVQCVCGREVVVTVGDIKRAAA